MQQNRKKNQENNKSAINSWARYSNLGFQMGMIIFLGVFGGFKLDRLTSMKFPLFTVILSMVSVFLAIYIAVKDLLKKQ